MRPLAPVRIRGEYNAPQPMTYDGSVWSAAWTDWLAKCRVCAESYGTAEHAEALAWAHGHMHVRHPGWHDEHDSPPTPTLGEQDLTWWRCTTDRDGVWTLR